METLVEKKYKSKNHIRIITATSLFDGHDVSINIMRRILQNSGAEVIHLGHNRSVIEIVNCAVQEDAQAIAITSYQGGHMEYLRYMRELLIEKKSSHIKIFGGGGGTILPSEIKELKDKNIAKIYSPDEGRRLGLQGMINDLLKQSDFSTTDETKNISIQKFSISNQQQIGNLISRIEKNEQKFNKIFLPQIEKFIQKKTPVIGITGTGGAGKSTLVDELVRRFILDFPEKTIAIISIDPSKKKTGGALLGDRIRMNSINNSRVYMRSMATREANTSINKNIKNVIKIYKAYGFDCIIIETSGIGQSGSEIVDYCDLSLYVMTPEYGAPSQLEKIEMLDFADLVAINKFDKNGSLDALKDVKKQFKRNKGLWKMKDTHLPIFGTIASKYNDHGTNCLYKALIKIIKNKLDIDLISNLKISKNEQKNEFIINQNNIKYLSEIVKINKDYDSYVEKQAKIAQNLFQLKAVINHTKKNSIFQVNSTIDNKEDYTLQLEENEITYALKDLYENEQKKLDDTCKNIIEKWDSIRERYQAKVLKYKVRHKTFEYNLHSTTLSNLKIPKICIPKFEKWDDIIKWVLKENVPGEFPFTAGVFPLKRNEETPTRMTAGEGGPERSNKRFHYLCRGQKGKRISTAHDSITLYGEDPDFRPDIYGKIGSTGVSVCNLDDTKKLYSGFNLVDSNTSVNLTINGPAPIILGFFLNAAIDQQCELYIKKEGKEEEIRKKIENYYADLNLPVPSYNGTLPEENDGLGLMLLGVTGDEVLDKNIYEKIKKETLSKLRGTVQADILKEDQAQNTCIFSIDFALKLMGDIQEYFIQNNIKNFYSISVSGYHMAEAGATPVTQLAFTLANAFTFIEYFLSRGMLIDDFAPNMSFFFSNGMDPEYAVLGRVARRIWAKTIKYKYRGNERSQKLKYHIQTSGRSLHAQEIGFNDIRTTLQALYALSDNCNSLHTNANDEAISLPTEDSVRRALAIQLIVNKELGLTRNENPLQGSFIIDELTNKVEKAVLEEFENISNRGGVMGAMERMYQRTKIQEESMHYEMLKHTGELPIIGVNTFLNDIGSPTIIPKEVTKFSKEERDYLIHTKELFQQRNKNKAKKALNQLKESASKNKNIFDTMVEVCKVCTLGQMTEMLYKIGGQFRRNT